MKLKARHTATVLFALSTGLLAGRLPGFEGGVDFRFSTLEIDRQRTGMFWAHLNGDELLDLLVTDDARFKIYFQTQGGGGFSAENAQVIEEQSGGALYDLADLDGDGIMELVVLDQREVTVFRHDPGSGLLVKEPRPLLDGLRGVAVQHLVPADFMFDIDADGDEDLIYPLDGKYYLFFQDEGVLTKENQMTTKPISVKMSVGEDLLRDRIEASVTIPRLNFVDLNGDGRLDLRVSNENRESFYIQSEQGVIPETPSYEVDLSRFKVKSKGPAGMNIVQFQFIPGDLNADGREDYTIVSGNRIRTFLATEEGVDFSKPNDFLKLSTEYMTVVLLPLNDDARPDLLILKYQIPSFGRIVAGLAVGLRFEIELLGYYNTEEAGISKRPDHRSTMVFKIPPILKLLGELESLAEQFRDIGRRVVVLSSGDYDGDGKSDALKLEDASMNFYLSDSGEGQDLIASFEEYGEPDAIRKMLFEPRRREVTLDTIMSFFTDVVASVESKVIAEREPSFRIPLDEEIIERTERIQSRDLNADGMDDVIIFLEPDPEDERDEEVQRLLLWMSKGKENESEELFHLIPGEPGDTG